MKYDYKIETTPKLTEVHLNALGAEGWEHYQVDGFTHYFKRQILAEGVLAPYREEVKTTPIQSNKKKK